MRIAVIGAGVAGLVAAYRLDRRRARGRRLRALARARRPGRDDRRRRRPPARALLPPPVHHRPPHRRALRRARDAGRARVAAVERRDVRPRPPVAVHDAGGPAALRPAAAVRPRADGRRRARAAAARQRPRAVRADHRARVDREAHGQAPRGARCGGRCCAASSARARTRSRWCGSGTSCGCGAGRTRARSSLGYPAARGSRCSRRCERAIEARGGRVLIDRPAVRIERRLRGHRRRAGSFRAGHDPRAFEPAGAERYDRVLATVPNDVFERSCTGAAPSRSIEYFAALCLLLELDRPFSGFYWTNVADRELPFVGLIEHTNFVEPARYDGRRFLYVANYLEHGHELLVARRRRAAGALPAGPAQGQPGLRPRVGEEPRGCTASRPPSRSSRSATTSGSRRCRRRSPGLVLANTTQVYPEDRGTNYAVRLGDQAARGGAGMTALGVDVGGTFTDAVLVTDDGMVTAKVLSTARQEEGVVAAAREVLERAGVEPGDVTHFVHGSTVATNALLERRLARTALVTTKGFRDLLFLGRQARPEPVPAARGADAAGGRAPPLRRGRRADGARRGDPRARRGERGARGAAARARAREAVAVCLLFAFLRSRARGARGGDPARGAAGRVRGRLARGGRRGARVRARHDRHGRRRARPADRPLPEPAARRRPRRPGCPSRT